ECMLRAYKGRHDSTYDERHDLLRLFLARGMLRVDRAKLRANHWSEAEIDAHLGALHVAVNEIYRLWSNTYRFASEERLRAHLKKTTGLSKDQGRLPESDDRAVP